MQLDLELEKPGWGGKRKGAGRKRSGKVSHAVREHHGDYPVLVTMKVVDDLPKLRGQRLGKMICRTFREQMGRHPDFRVVHLTLQTNHLHLIVEAGDVEALSRSMQGLKSLLARQINARLGRSGKLWRDRYHSRELTSPTQVRNAIRYTLQNTAHHGGRTGIDPLSSAIWADVFHDHAARTDDPPVATPQTWLLATGWHTKTTGKLSVHERPK